METFGKAMKRMAEHTMLATAKTATAQAMQQYSLLASVHERKAPWPIRWVKPFRTWWDERESKRCLFKRACHTASAAAFLDVANLAGKAARAIKADTTLEGGSGDHPHPHG